MIKKACGVQTLGSQPICCTLEFLIGYKEFLDNCFVIWKYNEQSFASFPSSLSLFSLSYGDFLFVVLFLILLLLYLPLYCLKAHYLFPSLLSALRKGLLALSFDS